MVNSTDNPDVIENADSKSQVGTAAASDKPQETQSNALDSRTAQRPETEATTDAAATSEGDRTSPEENAVADTAEKSAEPAQQLIFDTSAMTPHERFQATKRLFFVKPDVPPVPPRPRRSDLRQLDDLLDKHLRQPNRGSDARHSGGQDRGSRGSDHLDNDARHNDNYDDESQNSGSSRRRRRNRGGNDDSGTSRNASRSDRADKSVITEPQKVKGSTRLEAKKQRRRDGREIGRRRSVITESEFLARRESVDRKMVVRSKPDRVQIGVLEDNVLVEHYVARSSENSIIGNVYLGRVQNVLPSMEAAFVDIGRGRNAVLYSGEVDWSEHSGSSASRKIEKVLTPGDEVLVQVTKDPVGHKGARLTSQISLPGRYLVYVPGGSMNGISRKLPDTERARLKKVLKEIVPDGAGVIVRTAAEGASEEQLTRDVKHLMSQWEDIQKSFSQGGNANMLHSEPDMLIKIVRDVFNEDFNELVIEGEDTFKTIESYLSKVAPDLLERVQRYEGERDAFDKYRVTEQIQKALDRKVWLPSGGSLVIDRTEAMTVIDVNTGKFVGSGGNLEETVTKNNLEAAEEIVRQLRLRDTGGIIVIDFIDMVLESNRDLVLRRLVECLGRDRTKHQVAEVTSLGLVQMTRKKLGLGLLESFSEACETCAGRGVIVHHEPVVKHHKNDGSKRRKNSRNSSPNNQQQHQPNGGAHAITDGAKNMLAQIAAKTIHAEQPESDAGIAAASTAAPKRSQSEEPAAQLTVTDGSTTQSAQSEHPSAEKKEQEKAQADPEELIAAIPRKDVSERQPKEDVSNLLDSLLDALPVAEERGTETPEKPTTGTTKRKSRRVTTQVGSPEEVSPTTES
ncbi:MAG: Rne/Rng family ribonuclease [Canibacter sp.]